MKKKYLKISQSSFSLFEKCSKGFEWQFIDEIPFDCGADNIYSVFGTSFHKAIELHEKFKLTCDELINGWKTLFLSIFLEAKFLQDKDYELKEKYVNLGRHFLVNAFSMKERWKNYKTIDIEKYVKIVFENKFMQNVFLTGKIDLILKDSDTYVCLDWKTSKHKDNKIDLNDQLTFYIFFMHTMLHDVSLRQIYGSLAYPYDKEILFTQRTQEDIEKLFVRINMMLERINCNDFKKEPKLNFRHDDCFFCPYKKRCENVD